MAVDDASSRARGVVPGPDVLGFNPYEPPLASAGPSETQAVGHVTTSLPYRLTAADFVGVPIVIKTNFWGRVVGWLYILAILTCLISIPVILEGVRPPGRWLAVTPPILYLGWFVGFPLFQSLRARWGGGTGEDASDPRGHLTATLTAEALVVSLEGVSEVSRSWAGIARIEEISGVIAFVLEDFDYRSRRLIAIGSTSVPLRAFSSPDEAQSFLHIARRYHAERRPSA